MKVAPAAVTVATLLIAVATATPLPAWSAFGGDMGRRSYINATFPAAPNVTLLWNSTASPFGPVSPVSPVVTTDGRLFSHSPTGVDECNLLCVNVSTGIPIMSVFSWRDLDTPCVSPSLTADEKSVVIFVTQFGTATAFAFSTTSDDLAQSWALTFPPGQTIPYGVALTTENVCKAAASFGSGGNAIISAAIGAQSWGMDVIGGAATHWSPSLDAYGAANSTNAVLSLVGGKTSTHLAVASTDGWSVQLPGVALKSNDVQSYPVSAGAGVVLASALLGAEGGGFNVTFNGVRAGRGNTSAAFVWQFHGRVPYAWSVPMASEGVNAFFAANDTLSIVDLPTGALRGGLPCPSCVNPPLIVWSHVIALSAAEGCALGYYRWDLSAAPFKACVPAGSGVPVTMAVADDGKKILLITTDANAVFAFRLQ